MGFPCSSMSRLLGSFTARSGACRSPSPRYRCFPGRSGCRCAHRGKDNADHKSKNKDPFFHVFSHFLFHSWRRRRFSVISCIDVHIDYSADSGSKQVSFSAPAGSLLDTINAKEKSEPISDCEDVVRIIPVRWGVVSFQTV